MKNCKTDNCLNLKLGLPERKDTISKPFTFAFDDTTNHPILQGRAVFEDRQDAQTGKPPQLFGYPVQSASLKTLQISGLNESNLASLKLAIKREIGNTSETKIIDLEPFNTMDAYQTGKITIPCTDVKIYAEDTLYISAENTSADTDSTLLVTASFNYEL